MALFGLPESPKVAPTARGKAGEDACTEALADDVLDSYPARRANLLKFRSIRRLESGALDAAIEDARAIPASLEGVPDAEDTLRTLRASAQLIEAFALLRKNETSEVEPLLASASELRPYGYGLQFLAARLFALTPDLEAGERVVLKRLTQVDPDGLRLQADALDWAGEAEGAFQAWSAFYSLQNPEAQALADERFATKLGMVEGAWRAAVAATLAGRTEEAAEWRAKAEATPALFAEDQSLPPQLASLAASVQDLPKKMGERYAALLTALEAKAAGETAIDFSNLPTHPAALQLLPDLVAAPLKEKLFADRRFETQVEMLAKLLPELKLSSSANSYTAKGWKASGFKAKNFGDGVGKTVTYSGARSSSLATQEMVLLRAAELALKEQRSHFVVLGRREYIRTLTQYTYGVAGDTTPNGFQSELDVAFIDPAAPGELAPHVQRAVDAQAVVATLLPVYKPAPADRSAKRR